MIKHRQILFIRQRSIESKHQLLINGRKKAGIKKLRNPKVFIDYSQTIDDVYVKLEDYNLMKKIKC